MANTVIGFFDDVQDARRAVEELQDFGISDANIDLAQGGSYSNTTTESSSDSTKHEGGNAITRFFNSLFGDDSDDAKRYSNAGANSNYIVTVHADSEEDAEEAADILDECGALDVDERAGHAGSDNQVGVASENRTGDSQSIDRIEEELQVGKREVETGRVRLRSRIVETPVEEHVRLREESLNIERTAVNRSARSGELENFEEKEIELTERAEVPVVSKEARVVEEIRVTKDVNERDEVIRDTVRHTDIDIDEDRDSRASNDRYTDDGSTSSAGRTGL